MNSNVLVVNLLISAIIAFICMIHFFECIILECPLLILRTQRLKENLTHIFKGSNDLNK